MFLPRIMTSSHLWGCTGSRSWPCSSAAFSPGVSDALAFGVSVALPDVTNVLLSGTSGALPDVSNVLPYGVSDALNSSGASGALVNQVSSSPRPNTSLPFSVYLCFLRVSSVIVTQSRRHSSRPRLVPRLQFRRYALRHCKSRSQDRL